MVAPLRYGHLIISSILTTITSECFTHFFFLLACLLACLHIEGDSAKIKCSLNGKSLFSKICGLPFHFPVLLYVYSSPIRRFQLLEFGQLIVFPFPYYVTSVAYIVQHAAGGRGVHIARIVYFFQFLSNRWSREKKHLIL